MLRTLAQATRSTCIAFNRSPIKCNNTLLSVSRHFSAARIEPYKSSTKLPLMEPIPAITKPTGLMYYAALYPRPSQLLIVGGALGVTWLDLWHNIVPHSDTTVAETLAMSYTVIHFIHLLPLPFLLPLLDGARGPAVSHMQGWALAPRNDRVREAAYAYVLFMAVIGGITFVVGEII